VWSIETSHVILLGRAPGGAHFTRLVDAAIRTQAAAGGVPLAAISTNQRTDKPDGGVDTKVDLPIPRDPTGWLTSPTIWQYKAEPIKHTTRSRLQNEITKPTSFARECIQRGYAFRYCVCDSLPARTKDKWEAWLAESVRRINANAPTPRVVSADDLAVWISRFPALVASLFDLGSRGTALHLAAWQKSIRDVTPQYVWVPAWRPVEESIRTHVRMDSDPMEAVLLIQGEAGVGKTRMTFEVLADSPGLDGLVLYTDDERHAQEVARQLANDDNLKAVLVVDECSVQARLGLEGILRGHRSRIRIIAIDNSGERPPSSSPEYTLTRIQREIVHTILDTNFPLVSLEHRHAYAELSQGFVRLAADLCRSHAKIAIAGHVGPVLPVIDAYLTRRLSDNDLRVVEAVALVTKVGFKEDVGSELDQLCGLTDLSPYEIRDAARRLHDAPGFITMAGRYLYVTPAIIGQVAFDRAWRRWGHDDPGGFVRRIPDALLEPFLQRVARSADEEVRQIVGNCFRAWVHTLTPEHLADFATVRPLVILTETDPDTYFPRLRALVEHGSREQLLRVTSEGAVGWAGRRQLVWLAERLAAFPGYFYDAERILLHLALAETEPAIGNNATRIWRQLFRIYLSGTGIPFPQRLELLKQRIYSADRDIAALGMAALSELFYPYSHRMLGPAVVSGRIPPPEWTPASSTELRDSHAALVGTVVDLAMGGDEARRNQACDLAVTHMRWFLMAGYLSDVQRMLDPKRLAHDVRVAAAAAVDVFLRFDVERADHRMDEDYVAAVRAWLSHLRPSDVHGRLLAALSKNQWSYTRYEEVWRTELRALASHLYEDQPMLKQELAWLCSPEALNAGALGYELALLDRVGALIDLLVQGTMHFPSAALARGYIHGLVETRAAVGDCLNRLLDDIEQQAPERAFQLAIAAGHIVHPAERAFRLIDARALPPAYLQALMFGSVTLTLNAEEYKEALHRLVIAAESGDSDAQRVCMDTVAYLIVHSEASFRDTLFGDYETRELIWRVLAVVTETRTGVSGQWVEVLSALITLDPDRVAQLAVQAMMGDGAYGAEESKAVLARMAPDHPDIVIKRWGDAALDPQRSWHFYLDNYKTLVAALPTEAVKKWLRAVGIEGARALARHLPIPYFAEGEHPVVPPLTEYVLTQFADDERVFSEFCAGTHSLQWYMGDIAAQKEREAEMAKPFLHHPLPRIREWARVEIASSRQQAARWRQEHEEMVLE